MDEPTPGPKEFQEEENKTRLRNLVVKCVSADRIKAISVDGGRFISEERRQRIIQEMKAAARAEDPVKHTLDNLKYLLRSQTSYVYKWIVWDLRKLLGRLPKNEKELLELAVKLDLGGPWRVTYLKRHNEFLRDLLAKERAQVLLLDHLVDPKDTTVSYGHQAPVAWSEYMERYGANAEIKRVTVEEEEVERLAPQPKKNKGNALLIEGLDVSGLISSQMSAIVARRAIENGIGGLLLDPDFDLRFTARGKIDYKIEGLGNNKPLDITNASLYDQQTKKYKVIPPAKHTDTVAFVEKWMEP